jgi:hypothetical protein
LSAFYRGRGVYCESNSAQSSWLYIREGRSAERDLAVFNIAPNPPIYKGAIEKNRNSVKALFSYLPLT